MKKFFLFAIFGVLLLISNKKNGSLYGRYDLVTKNSAFKEILDKQNAHIVLNKDRTIILHSETSGWPIIHREGTFKESHFDKKLTQIITFFDDQQPPYCIKIEDGDLHIGESIYSK